MNKLKAEQKYFQNIPVYEWDDLEGKNLIIRVSEDTSKEDNNLKLLCGYDPIDGIMYVLADKLTS